MSRTERLETVHVHSYRSIDDNCLRHADVPVGWLMGDIVRREMTSEKQQVCTNRPDKEGNAEIQQGPVTADSPTAKYNDREEKGEEESLWA